MATTPSPQAVASAFVTILRGWLTPEEWAEMVRRNLTYRVNGDPYCASHEFCDPNQAMIDACDSLGADWRTDADAAWALAAAGPLSGNEWPS